MVAALAVAFGVFGSDAHALALGRITVQSALGEPLRAEIDIPDINAEEAASLKSAVASPEAFKAAGLEYSPAMAGLQVSLQRRADGRAYLRLTSERPVSDPFIDLILETSWSSGRIVRDYTMLFDPPNLRQAGMAPTTAPQLSAASPTSSPRATPAAPPSTRPAPVSSPPSAPRAVAKAASGDGKQVKVNSGDTAGKIAAAHKPEQVSLDQMLVALLRANPDAFIGGNVNRIKAGSVLDIPAAEQAAATPSAEASKTILAQSRDFNDFRRKLAQAAPETQLAAADRKAGGKLQAHVEDKKPATAAPDKLTLSKGAVGAKAGEDKIASKREAQDAQARVAELSKNISELAKLEAASSAAGPAPAAPASAAKSGVPAGAVTPAQASASAAAPAAAVSTAAPAVAAASAAEPAASATAPAAPVAAASKPSAPAPTVAKPAPVTPEPQSDLLGELLDNPMIPAAAGGLIALLAGFGFYRAQRRKKSGQVDSSFLESRLQPDSFFGSSGGQHVDTNEAAVTGSSMVYSPSQLDAAGDVDPVAEADVYLAYGRDLQAEEILKEAMRTNPSRVAIHAKLLEIYAKRRDTKAFEVIASQAYNLTAGEGFEWEQICELGQDLDPDNPLYHPGGQPAQHADAAGSNGASTVGYAASTVPHSTHAELSPSPLTIDLDLDLDFSVGDEPPAAAPVQASPMAVAWPAPVEPKPPLNGASPAHADLDMDLGAASFSLDGAAAEAGAGPEPIDLSLDLLIPEMPMDDDGLRASPPPAPADAGMIEFDLGALSLDLGTPASATAASASDEAVDSDDPLATKLALAEEFRTLGDADGARALADEVVAQASGSLKTRAQRLIADLG